MWEGSLFGWQKFRTSDFSVFRISEHQKSVGLKLPNIRNRSPSFTSESKMASRGKSKIFDRSRIFASNQLQPPPLSGLTQLLIQSYQGPWLGKQVRRLFGNRVRRLFGGQVRRWGSAIVRRSGSAIGFGGQFWWQIRNSQKVRLHSAVMARSIRLHRTVRKSETELCLTIGNQLAWPSHRGRQWKG